MDISSERSPQLIEQLAFALEELEADTTEDELAAERALAKMTTVQGFTCKRAERQNSPERPSRERAAIDPLTACECCGGGVAPVEDDRDGAVEALLPRLRED